MTFFIIHCLIYILEFNYNVIRTGDLPIQNLSMPQNPKILGFTNGRRILRKQRLRKSFNVTLSIYILIEIFILRFQVKHSYVVGFSCRKMVAHIIKNIRKGFNLRFFNSHHSRLHIFSHRTPRSVHGSFFGQQETSIRKPHQDIEGEVKENGSQVD